MTSSADPSTSCQVRIVGRLGSRVDSRELPSGDTVVTFTIVVDRPRRARSDGTRARVDAIPCQAFLAPVRRRVTTLEPGTLVEAEGRLRRRFWRNLAGPSSVLDVEVTKLRLG
jgi:single-strand DNA-binding protein